jgi:hypothetical protein
LNVIQVDVANRGLARDPIANLFNACLDDFGRACSELAQHPKPVLAVVTGFSIPLPGSRGGDVPAAPRGETDGPLGAVYLARTLSEIGIKVLLASDPFGRRALEAGLRMCDRLADTPVLDLPLRGVANPVWWDNISPRLTHVLAVERVGPSHTLESLRAQAGATETVEALFRAEVPVERQDRCYTMRGVDITDDMRDGVSVFTQARDHHLKTIGIGDGGNEIGMGKIPWEVIRRNIPGGGGIACRVATDHLLVAGTSNWGAYALAAGVAVVRGLEPPAAWFDEAREHGILECMVTEGPLVDGVTGQLHASVDGLAFEAYIEPLRRMANLVRT